MSPRLAGTLRELTGPARGRLLQVLKAAPDAGVHVRELSRIAGLSLSSLQRELERMSSLGLTERAEQGRRVLYRLRRADPFVRLLLAAAVTHELKGKRFDRMPSDRQEERALVELCAHLPADAALWGAFGDREFLAGLTVALAGHAGFERAAYLGLAESLAPGSSRLERHEAWHGRHRPDLPRLFALIDRERRTYARARA
jgi:DNA-binding transcriptional ArsR family regulator